MLGCVGEPACEGGTLSHNRGKCFHCSSLYVDILGIIVLGMTLGDYWLNGSLSSPPLSQKGDILLKINDIPLLGKEHAEAIHMIRNIMSASTIRMELIQGDQPELSPDWSKWVQRYEAQSRHQR